jgi:hypothetical protein
VSRIPGNDRYRLRPAKTIMDDIPRGLGFRAMGKDLVAVAITRSTFLSDGGLGLI